MPTLLQPGDICAGHRIQCHLGTGGAAEVYAARLDTGELRAFKLMSGKGDIFAKARKRFVQEAHILTAIVHPNIVGLHDVGEWGERLWLSLDLIEAATWGQRLRGTPRPSLDDILAWVQQLCEGLAEAHRVKVVHRDLTPDNILVTPNGCVKIIDFGLSKVLRSPGVETTHEWLRGSAMYMSPEQLQGAPASPAMDVYAIGHLLYEACAGVHAMGAGQHTLPESVIWQHTQQPRPLHELSPYVSADLEALVHQALDKDPKKRPESVRDISAAVRDVRQSLRAPQRRAARNLLSTDKDASFAPTIPMAACAEPAPAAPGTPARAAMPPAAPPADVSPASRQAPPPPNTLRSSDVPVEGGAPRPSAAPARIPAVALAVGVLLLVASPATWMLLRHVPGAAPAPASEPPPAAFALPPAPVPVAAPAPSPPAPTATASAATAPPTPPRVKTPPRAPAPRPPVKPPPAATPPAKNRVFGTSD